MLSEKQAAAFEKFFDAARDNGVLDGKTTLLVQLGAAMAVGCYP